MNAGYLPTESGNPHATTYSGSTSSLMLQVAEQVAADTHPAAHALAPCRLSPVALRGPLRLPEPETSKVWTGRRPAAAGSLWGGQATPWRWAGPGHPRPQRRLQRETQLSATSLEGERQVWGVEVLRCGRGWQSAKLWEKLANRTCLWWGGWKEGGPEPWGLRASSHYSHYSH